MPCRIEHGTIYTLQTVALENEHLRAVVLVGKGADLLDFIWKPQNVNALYRSDTPFEAYRDADLSKERLRCHSDRSLGGWMDALPHRGLYKGIELTQETGGLAATVPWSCEVVRDAPDEASVRCSVDLPIFPMHVEKTFTLREGSTVLTVGERVTFNGDEDVRFTWTQHALFGGGFVDESTVVDVPSDRLFKAWAHMADPGKPVPGCEDPVSAVALGRGVFDFRRPLPPDYAGSEFVVFNHLTDGAAALRSKSRNLTLRFGWELSRFPFLRSLYLSNGGCVVGLEPGDDLFSGFEHSLRYGTCTTMHSGETIATSFTLGFFEGA